MVICATGFASLLMIGMPVYVPASAYTYQLNCNASASGSLEAEASSITLSPAFAVTRTIVSLVSPLNAAIG